MNVRVEATRTHDTALFTEGLAIADGVLYESSGGFGTSELRATDLTTGAVRATRLLPRSVFAEGIGVDGDRIVQLTWRSKVAYVWSREGLKPRGTLSYDGEGWGLCRSPDGWVMSDGSDVLTIRDPATFAPLRRVDVRLDGRPVTQLNELECVGDVVYANVWRTDRIMRIEPSGRVSGVIDASRLPVPPTNDPEAVLNGIAAVPGTDRFILTGKRWPVAFEVTFRSAGRD